ncbi:MAG: hypothetical protein QOI16_1642, partial [Pseudonocardiales bacterium]|nr:hypothetical protein [Pseudonocardiales bacterium]
ITVITVDSGFPTLVGEHQAACEKEYAADQ